MRLEMKVAEAGRMGKNGAVAECGGIEISQLISALSFALDLTEGQPMGHAARACMLGMRLAQTAGLEERAMEDLYYALLLKDAGCSSNASKMFHLLGTDEIRAKYATKTLDWRRIGPAQLRCLLASVGTGRPLRERARAMFDIVLHSKEQTHELIHMRCERGAHIASRIGLSGETSKAIYCLDEHWDGGGHPGGLGGEAIPRMARILNLAQTLEVFHATQGPEAAIEVARQRSGRWFDPELVKVAIALDKNGQLWQGLEMEDALAEVVRMEPARSYLESSESTLDNICEAFAEVIDAKSHYTYNHSTGVTGAAVGIAKRMGLSAATVTLIRRAALLHDVGKLSVPNTILEKAGPLTPEEWDCVRRHPYYTYAVLSRITGFEELAEIAAAHHEKLDGSGYYRGLTAEQLTLPARILAVADIYDALASERPYRPALPLETVFELLDEETQRALDASCVEALREFVGSATPALAGDSIPLHD